jgi:hypothetical protein
VVDSAGEFEEEKHRDEVPDSGGPRAGHGSGASLGKPTMRGVTRGRAARGRPVWREASAPRDDRVADSVYVQSQTPGAPASSPQDDQPNTTTAGHGNAVSSHRTS